MDKPETDIAKPSPTNRDIIDRLTYPLLSKFAIFIPRSVHPNTVTGAAIAAAILASAALAFIPSSRSFLVCAALLVAWVIFDSLDGIHARNTGQCSKFGGFLDHFGDASGMFLLQAAIIYRFDIHEPIVFGAILLRQALATWTYIIQAHAGHLYISNFGWSSEIVTYAIFMCVIFLFPDIKFHIFSLPELSLMSNSLLIYYVAVPFTIFEIGLASLKTSKDSVTNRP